MTPIAKQKCSKRSFAGQITSWKKKVYGYVATLDEAAVAAATATAKTAGAMKELTSSASAENKVLGKLNTTPTKTSSSTENAGMLITPDAANASEPNTPPVAVSTPLEADDEEDEEFSDLDDIELDDQGNVITTEPAKSNLEDSKKPQNEDICVEDSPMSIFSAF